MSAHLDGVQRLLHVRTVEIGLQPLRCARVERRAGYLCKCGLRARGFNLIGPLGTQGRLGRAWSSCKPHTRQEQAGG